MATVPPAKSVKEIMQELPEEFQALPQDHKVWLRCMCPTEVFNKYEEIFKLPCVFVLGPIGAEDLYELAMTDSCWHYLGKDTNLDLRKTHLDSAIEPPFWTLTKAPASAMSIDSFLQRASAGILSMKHGAGLNDYFLTYTASNKDLQLAICWMCFIQHLMMADQRVLEIFFQLCVFIAIHTSDTNYDSNLDCVFWDLKTWQLFFLTELLPQRQRALLTNSEIAWFEYSMFDQLLDASEEELQFTANGSRPQLPLDAISLFQTERQKLSPKRSIEILGSVFHHGVDCAARPLGSIKSEKWKALIHISPVFEPSTAMSVQKIKDLICSRLPLAAPEAVWVSAEISFHLSGQQYDELEKLQGAIGVRFT